MKIVMKFGGTSVGSVPALEQVVTIIQQAQDAGHEVIAVVSAMSKVTDLLLTAANQAELGNETAVHEIRQQVEEKHQEATLAFLGPTDTQAVVMTEINQLLDEFESLCHGIHVLGELTNRALDVIGGLGERLSVRQVAAILQENNLPAVAVEATDLIVTDKRHGSASPLVEETAEKSRAVLNPYWNDNKIPVVTGFIAATVDGVQTTLGRGGSDYSATIIGRAIEADEVWIWTDVNGVMTADPRIVSDAKTIPHLSYAEVGELAYFGAKVLHPQAIRPARRANIPVRMLNTFDPDNTGTLMDQNVELDGHAVKGITVIKNLSMITVAGTGMMGVPGVAARIFSAVAQIERSVLMISQSSSEQSICFVVATTDAPHVMSVLNEEMARELERRDLDEIAVQDGVAILAVVGAGMKGTPGVSARVFSALGKAQINVVAIAQGSSEYNISVVALEGNADEAVRLIHAEFGLGEPG
ncbi:MAG: aspartate kinase [Chloroflexota bacterium]